MKTFQENSSHKELLLSVDVTPDSSSLKKVNRKNELTKYQINEKKELINVEGIKYRQKRIISKLNVSTIRDIFNYSCLLRSKTPIRVCQINLFKYKHYFFYKIILETKIGLSVYLDRTGNFIWVNLSPKSIPPANENPKEMHAITDCQTFDHKIELLIQKIYSNFDQKRVQSVLKDLFNIEHAENISCIGGNIVSMNEKPLYEFTLVCDILFLIFINPIGNFIGISFSNDRDIWKRVVLQNLSNKSFYKINLYEK
jgi:hypothetical protein